MRDKIADALQAASGRALAAVKQEVPVRSGALRNAISVRVLRRSLTMRFGLLTRKQQNDLFYGYILEVGRKAKLVTVKRRTSRGFSTYRLSVRPLSPFRFDIVSGRARQRVFQELEPALRNAYEKALRSLAGLSDAG